MKGMTMAEAMSVAIERVSSNTRMEISKVYPLEGSGTKNNYDYLLIGIEADLDEDNEHYHGAFEASVVCNEATGYKAKVDTIVVR